MLSQSPCPRCKKQATPAINDLGRCLVKNTDKFAAGFPWQTLNRCNQREKGEEIQQLTGKPWL
jgi:hypothetical protein